MISGRKPQRDSVFSGPGEARDPRRGAAALLRTIDKSNSPADIIRVPGMMLAQHFSNRRVRTRTHGGVAGVGSIAAAPMPIRRAGILRPSGAVPSDNVYPTLTRGATLCRASGPLEQQPLKPASDME